MAVANTCISSSCSLFGSPHVDCYIREDYDLCSVEVNRLNNVLNDGSERKHEDWSIKAIKDQKISGIYYIRKLNNNKYHLSNRCKGESSSSQSQRLQDLKDEDNSKNYYQIRSTGDGSKKKMSKFSSWKPP